MSLNKLMVAGLFSALVLVGAGCSSSLNTTTNLNTPAPQVAVNQNQPAVNSAPDKIVGEVVLQKSFLYQSKNYFLTHLCVGDLKDSQFAGLNKKVKFCLGKNSLALTSSNEKSIVISEVSTTDLEMVPFLIAELVGNGNVLISFQPNACWSESGMCGAGMPDNTFDSVLSLSAGTSRKIKNFPPYGKPIWNPSKTKALFLQYPGGACSGDSCNGEPIRGYDFMTDKKTDLTTLVGWDSQENASGAPYWENVKWLDDNNFQATNVDQAKKTTKVLKVKF